MKKTRIQRIVVFLLLISLILFLYQVSGDDNAVVENDEIEYEYIDIGVQHEKEESEDFQGEQTVISVLTQNIYPVTSPEICGTPFPTALPEISQEHMLTAVPKTSSKPVATMMPGASMNNMTSNEQDVTVKYDDKIIRYINTIYRIDEKLLDKIMSLICNEPYDSSFILYDIHTEAAIYYNENRYYPAASTVKAPFVLNCLQQIDNGIFSFEDKLQYNENHKWSGDGIIQYTEFGTEYTIKELTEYTIKVSDDTGYMMLLWHFGENNYNNFLEKLGNRVTIGGSVKWGNTSAIDSLRNWKEIYRYIKTGSERAIFFYDLLKETNKSYIRNSLGNKYTILNKMGWGVHNPCCHDQAIVLAQHPYVLIIMTMGDSGEKNQEFIEQLSLYLDEVHEEIIKVGGRFE